MSNDVVLTPLTSRPMRPTANYFNTALALGRLAAPTMLGALVSMGGQSIIARWLGQLNQDTLVALGPIGTAISFYSLCNGMVFSLSVLVSEVNAPENDSASENVRGYVQAALLLSSGVAVVLIPAMCFTGNAFAILGQRDSVALVINDYFRAFALSGGSLPMLVLTTLRRFCVGLQKTSISMMLTLSNVALWLACSYGALIFMPSASGFGYATSISSWLTVSGAVGYLLKSRDFSDYQLGKHAQQLRQYLKKIIQKGLPMMGNPLVESLAIAILSGIIARNGDVAAESYAIANQYARITIVIAHSLGAVLGTAMNKAKFQGSKALCRWWAAGLGMSATVCALPLLIGSFAAPNTLISLFKPNAVSTTAAQNILQAVAVGNAVDVVARIIPNAASRPFERGTYNWVVNTLSIGLGVLLAGLSAWLGIGGAMGMIIGFYIGVALASLLMVGDVKRSIDTLSSPVPTLFCCPFRQAKDPATKPLLPLANTK